MTDDDRLLKLLKTVVKLNEREWIEVKHNNYDPDSIGQYISAISNSTLLLDRSVGYIAWGIEDKSVRIVGTTFRPSEMKIGNEELECWLTQHLSPRIDFRVHEFKSDGFPMVIFEIPAASGAPTKWKETAYIRVGSYKKKLVEYHEKEKSLWSKLSSQCFETGIAARNLSSEQVLDIIDYESFYSLIGQPKPSDHAEIIGRLELEEFIVYRDDGTYDITNLGAILFTHNLRFFGSSLARKAVRVIVYKGKIRTEVVKERSPSWGYASIFKSLIRYVNSCLPQSERIGVALRQEVKVFPEIAIRELLANALVHQDLSMSGVSPMVEIFEDRVEITNPGLPLIDVLRFMDAPPISRNEKLTAIMRRCNVCEERGSGIDKTMVAIELNQMPPPDFIADSSQTRVVLYSPRKYSQMDKEERIRACYWHTCLKFLNGEAMTNASLRNRLSISDNNQPAASAIIKDTMEKELIKQKDPDSNSKKYSRYIPFWG